MSMTDRRINVWTSLDTEAYCERISRQARDIDEVAERIKRLGARLRVAAMRGDRDAECALAVLADEVYQALCEASA